MCGFSRAFLSNDLDGNQIQIAKGLNAQELGEAQKAARECKVRKSRVQLSTDDTPVPPRRFRKGLVI
jgi:hypothetical protein